MPLTQHIYTCALSFMADRSYSADITQEVMLRLWDNRKELAKIDNLKAYALCITRNICLDTIKKHKPIYDEAQTHRNEEVTDPLKQIETQDTATIVRQIIETLPPTQKEVIQLREIHELEYEEIAEITGLGLNNIRVLLSRARSKVKDILIKKYQFSQYE